MEEAYKSNVRSSFGDNVGDRSRYHSWYPKHQSLQPLGKLLVSRQQFVSDSFYAVELACLVLQYEPIPKCGAEVESIVKVLCADEYIGFKEVGHLNTNSQACSYALKGYRLLDTEESKCFGVGCSSLEDAHYERPGQSPADSRSHVSDCVAAMALR